jgi:hypothetical protein
MSGGDTAKIGRHIDEGTWHTLGGKVSPLSIVGSGPIPPSFMRTIPVTLLEKDIHVHVRGKVDIGPGDDEHRGGCRNQKGGRGGTLIPTLTRTSPKPLSARPISVRSVVATNNIVNIPSFHKTTSFCGCAGFISYRAYFKSTGQIDRLLSNDRSCL